MFLNTCTRVSNWCILQAK